jgi:hypothetical protein
VKVFSGWQPAKVMLCDQSDNLLISFLRCPRKLDIKISRNSLNIAPHRTYTDDWEWRFNLKPEDKLDCVDDYGIWYRSTVISLQDLDTQDCEGNSIPLAKIACRYKDPNGAKEDDDGDKVTGWISTKFDFNALLAQPHVMRWNSMTTQYFNVGGSSMHYELTVHDTEDTIYASSKGV